MNITEFLEARIAEDEARASVGWTTMHEESRWEVDNYGQNFLTPSAILAECAAKRAIIEDWDDPSGPGVWEGYGAGHALAADRAVRALAAVYKNHRDYRQEWALNG